MRTGVVLNSSRTGKNLFASLSFVFSKVESPNLVSFFRLSAILLLSSDLNLLNAPPHFTHSPACETVLVPSLSSGAMI